MAVPMISLQRLMSQNEEERERLYLACKSNGVFLLNLCDYGNDKRGGRLLVQAQQIFELARRFFDFDDQYKLGFEMDTWGDLQIGGYKPPGKHSGVLKGKRDGFENFLVPLNRLIGFRDGVVPGPLPPAFESEIGSLADFQKRCHEICNVILSNLSISGRCDNDRPLQDSHQIGDPSTTSLAMLKYLPGEALSKDQIGHMSHTDVGSLTLVFTGSPGLEILDQETSSWIAVNPPTGTVAVNAGDALRFLSGGCFASCIHRVVPQVDQETGLSATRFSLAFFHRPALRATFQDERGQELTGEQWHKKKYRIFRATNEEQLQNSLLTGKVGFLGEFEGKTLEKA
ncbi:Clavaminate synthase-like protein [Xylaria sp. FL0064]|nr:Clavaminate synthase-like protein [Xylaria sp. FL0064]